MSSCRVALGAIDKSVLCELKSNRVYTRAHGRRDRVLRIHVCYGARNYGFDWPGG